MTKIDPLHITETTLNQKACKTILVLIICGLLAIAVDLILASSANSIGVIHKDGATYLLRPDAGSSSESISLNAEIRNGNSLSKEKVNLVLDPYSLETKSDDGKADDNDDSKEMSKQELVSSEIRSLVFSINDDTSLRQIKLPAQLPSGEKLKWTVQKNTNTAIIAFTIMALSFLVYRKRLSPLKKLRQLRQASITSELPEFINRIVLLLNAGLVLDQAFEKSVEQGLGNNKNPSGESDYFYSQMNAIYTRIRETNSSMTQEFRTFAKSCRSTDAETAKELMRISNIFNDNISKGVELTQKLQRESEILWINRKRSCEERGRLSESLLSFPLTLYLLVLIVLTVSPALLEL